MKSIILRGLLVALILPIIWGDIHMTDDKKIPVPDSFGCRFIDGDGKVIPTEAVRLLVRAEFKRLTFDEITIVVKHFPQVQHLCTYSHCPMSAQIRFHGCGECKENSECWMIDRAHWDNPLWTYDDCYESINPE